MPRRPGSTSATGTIAPADLAGQEPASLAPVRWLLLAIATGSMLSPLNSTMIAVALPEIRDAFGASLTAVTLLVSSYLVVTAVGLPIGGRMGDLVGRRRMFLIGLVLFAVGSLVCALAGSLAVLLGGRLLQAAAGAIALPNGTAMIREYVPEHVRGRAFGLMGMAFGVSAASGPPLGSLLIGAFGWPAMFWASVPISLAAIALGIASLPRGERTSRRPASLDLPGGLLFALALGGIVLVPTIYRGSGWLLALGVLAAAGLAARWFVMREAGQATPMIAIRLFLHPAFAYASTSVALSNLVMYTSLLAIPIYMTQALDRSLQEAGIVLAILSGLSALGGPIGGRWADRSGKRRPAIAGGLAILAGALLLLLSVALDREWLIVPAMFSMGAGLGLSGAPVQLAAIESAPLRESGAAAGLYSTCRYIGSVVGSTILAILLAGEPARGDARRFGILFTILVLFAVAGAIVNARIEVAPALEAEPSRSAIGAR